MNLSKMKNMIVVRNLPSNIIEEAFIILKPNQKIKVQDIAEKNKEGDIQKENSNGYVLREAEMVISNYISGIEGKKEIKSSSLKKLEEKYKKLKSITIFLGIVVILTLFKNLI